MEDLLNIYICIIAPLLLTLFLLKGSNRIHNLFLIIGMTACLTAGYINVSVIGHSGYTPIQFTYYIAPIYEEVLKALPILIFLLLKKPDSKLIISSALSVGVGFATLENIYYIMSYGAKDFMFLLLRGFSTGIMHSLCTAIIGFGFSFIYRHKGMAFSGTFGLLCGTITYHATYNLLVSSSDPAASIGVFMPITTAVLCVILLKRNVRSYNE